MTSDIKKIILKAIVGVCDENYHGHEPISIVVEDGSPETMAGCIIDDLKNKGYIIIKKEKLNKLLEQRR